MLKYRSYQKSIVVITRRAHCFLSKTTHLKICFTYYIFCFIVWLNEMLHRSCFIIYSSMNYNNREIYENLSIWYIYPEHLVVTLCCRFIWFYFHIFHVLLVKNVSGSDLTWVLSWLGSIPWLGPSWSKHRLCNCHFNFSFNLNPVLNFFILP